MSKTFAFSKDEIARLCRYFTTNRKSFLAPGVKEAHVRQTLIDPFFQALGWDLRNIAMTAPQYREVVTEDSLDVEGHQKAPDYTFRLGTLPKFYVEAKKCGININADPAPAYQLRRYGFSAKLPLSILTDFEELSVFDCSSRPRPSDKASHARIQYFGFSEYPDRWREIWDIFSREAVWSGAFDQYAASKRKRGTSEVDGEFLKDIEGWREVLARNLALRNNDLSADELNAAVQKIIDRLIFLRMAEDRGLESYGQLLKLCERPKIYARFVNGICRMADQKYNSGLFHFEKEPGVTDAPDSLTPDLIVDDNAIKPILQSLYFEHGSPYNFGVMPVEILGTVYERFLGKVIRLTAGHQAKVEEKPEVRKAGGVYYTPAYIVNYIVQNTVGKQVEGKTPADLAGNKTNPPFRVLDMACGSGSFLLGAYQFLLDHCLKWYQANPQKKHASAVYKNAKGETCLSIAERKRILITHIFGVDIDRQAVETTKLSLLLKALEGENDTSLSKQMSLFHERALPNLSDNIKCGNSLIASDFSMLPEDLVRVNAFDWPAQFPEAMKAGGFDAIIGNPPYIRIQTMQESSPESVNYLKEHYTAASKGNYDIYVVFVERALTLLNLKGRLGYILPHKFFNAQYGETLREILARGRHLSHIVHFGDQQIFEGATTYTCLLLLTRSSSEKFWMVKVNDLETWQRNGSGMKGDIFADAVSACEWNFHVGPDAGLFSKLSSYPLTLRDIASRIAQGIRTSANEVYVLDILKDGPRVLQAQSEILGHEVKVDRKSVLRFLQGREIKRYCLLYSGKVVIIPYSRSDAAFELIPEIILKKSQPNTYEYLRENKSYLEEREHGRMQGQDWFGFIYPKNIDIMHCPKILIPDIADGASYALDQTGEFAFTSGYGITLKPEVNVSLKYVLGLLNSKLLNFFLKKVSTTMRGGFFRYFTQFIEKLPVVVPILSNPPDRVRHDRIVELVEKMLVLSPMLRRAISESEKTTLQNAVTTTDAEIDRLVYELYDLTEEEIKILEGDT